MSRRALLAAEAGAGALLSAGLLAWFGLDFGFAQLNLLFTYALAGLGVVIILGHSGQIVLGQGAFVALGAYAQAILVGAGLPPLLALPLAALAGAGGGLLASLPAARLGGIYFGLSTFAFALLIEEMLRRWDSLTGGAAGLLVASFSIGRWQLDQPAAQAGFSLLLLLLAILLCRRLLASALGRSWHAVREDEAAAAACAVNAVRAKTAAFVLGGTLSGLGGALYAHWIAYLSPEQFGLRLSFELLILAFLGGVQRLGGVLWGAALVVALPQAIALLRDHLPGEWTRAAGFELFVFGAVVVAVVLLRTLPPRPGTGFAARPPEQSQ